MHIAIDARIINSTTGRYVERLLTYLQEIDRTNQYTVLVPSRDKDYWKPKYDNFSVITADFDNFSFAEQWGLRKLLKTLKPDLVHFGIVQQPILYKGKKVTTFHDMTLIKTYNSDKNWFIYHAKQFVGRFVFHSIARTNNHIITPTEFTKKELLEFTHIPEEKVTVIYEASDVATGASRKYPLEYKEYIMYVGQQSDYKNVKRLGDAHQKLLESHPDLGLVLVGRKNASALKNEAYFTKKQYKNIVFTDFVSDDQLNWLYAHAKAYIFPSLMEGFGLPGLEAMGHGTPVVSSNATCLPEVYGDAAIYFNPTNVNDMMRATEKVLSDEKLQTKLAGLGFKQIKKYSWKRMAEQTYAIYKKILED